MSSLSSFQLGHQLIRASRPPLCCTFAFYVVVSLPSITPKKKIKEPNLAAEASRDVLLAFTSYARGDRGGVLRSAMDLVKTATGKC